MVDVIPFRMLRNHNQRDACAIAEEIEVLDKPGVIVTAALIHSDEDRGSLPKCFVALDGIDNFFDEALEQVLDRVEEVLVVEGDGGLGGFGGGLTIKEKLLAIEGQKLARAQSTL